MKCPECNLELDQRGIFNENNEFVIKTIWWCDRCHIRIEKTELKGGSK